jgi:hypothetical protein
MGAVAERPKVVFANANVGDPRFRDLFMFHPTRVGIFSQSAGFDGVEWTPLFDWLATPGLVAKAVQEKELALNSLHASFRTTRRSRGTNKHPDAPSADSGQERIIDAATASPIGRLLMPEVVASSRFMRSVKRRVGARPSVLYPQPDVRLDRRALANAGPGPKLVQVTDHVAAMVGADSPKAFVDIMHGRGYEGWILDRIHMDLERYDGRYRPVISDLDRSLPVLQAGIYGAHIALNRSDIVPPGSKLAETTRGDLKRALDGEYTGVAKAIMDAAWEAPNFEYAALETTAAGVSAVTQHRDRETLLGDYRLLAQSIREYRAA